MAALIQDANNLVAGITYLQAQVRPHEPQFADALCAAIARYNEDQMEVVGLRTRLIQIGDNRRLQSSSPPINPGWFADYRSHLKEELIADVLRAVIAARGAGPPSWIAAGLGGVLEGWGRLVGSGATSGGPTPGGPVPTAPAPSGPAPAK